MKKLLLLFFFVLFCISSAFSYTANRSFEKNTHSFGINSGNLMFDIGLGGTFFATGASETNLKKSAFMMNIRGLYAVDENFHVGLEGIFGSGGIKGDSLPYGREYDSPNFYVEKDDNYHDTFAILLALRANLNPNNRARVYLPFGFGYMQKNQSTEYTAHSLIIPGYEHEFKEDKTLGRGVYAYSGLGLEYDLGAGFLTGIEARYGVFKCSGDYVTSISALIKIGFKL